MLQSRTVMSGVREALDRMHKAGGLPDEVCCVTMYLAPNLWCDVGGRHVLWYELKRQHPEIYDIECAQHLEDDTVLLMMKTKPETSDDSDSD